MTLPQYSTYAYSKATGFENFSYQCITYMLEQNDVIWKLIKYNTPDALLLPDLTLTEKRELIFRGQPDDTLYRVFASAKQPGSWTHEAAFIRIYPAGIYPNNRTINTVTMIFDVYSHYRIDTLENANTRIDTLTAEILRLFNGAVVGGIGRLTFDALQNRQLSIRDDGQIPYGGKRIALSNNVA